MFDRSEKERKKSEKKKELAKRLFKLGFQALNEDKVQVDTLLGYISGRLREVSRSKFDKVEKKLEEVKQSCDCWFIGDI